MNRGRKKAHHAAAKTHHRSRKRQVGTRGRLVEQAAQHLAAAGVGIAFRPVDNVCVNLYKSENSFSVKSLKSMMWRIVHPSLSLSFPYLSYHRENRKKRLICALRRSGQAGLPEPPETALPPPRRIRTAQAVRQTHASPAGGTPPNTARRLRQTGRPAHRACIAARFAAETAAGYHAAGRQWPAGCRFPLFFIRPPACCTAHRSGRRTA